LSRLPALGVAGLQLLLCRTSSTLARAAGDDRCGRLPSAPSVERATILLTDLLGSARAATSVGPVPTDELREEHFNLLRQAIASTGGREVKNAGDG
jgi:class 3 adenylate cyclase